MCGGFLRRGPGQSDSKACALQSQRTQDPQPHPVCQTLWWHQGRTLHRQGVCALQCVGKHPLSQKVWKDTWLLALGSESTARRSGDQPAQATRPHFCVR